MAMFQRRHYETIAGIIASAVDVARTSGDMFAVDTLTTVGNQIATVFAVDNPRFKRARFCTAANVPDSTAR